MTLLFWVLIFLVALLVLIKSSDWVVEGASRVGAYFRLPSFIIGIILVGLGTSLPELSSSLAAVFQGKEGIVAANVIGSNIANILLVLGVAIFIGKGLVLKKKFIYVDQVILLGMSLVFFLIALNGNISGGEGIILLSLSLGYIFYNLSQREKGKS